jgi:GH15 family glucan-1,4-alpha-glucosidase
VLDAATAGMLRQLGTYVAEHWREPDDGIWEPRAGREHHVHSRALCWVALDRLLRLDHRGVLALGGGLRHRFERERSALAEEIRARGWNPEVGSYVASYGATGVDASLLLLGWYGFEDPASSRMRATASTIDRVLGVGRGLVRRNLDIPEDGGFVACSFWAVEQLARAGCLEDARARFEGLLALAPESGLFAEIVDGAGTHVGNYPQAFSHLALVSAALALEEGGGAAP